MTIAMQPIYTQTLSSAAASVTFNNIPQTFTDLVLYASVRDSFGTNNAIAGNVYFNGASGTNLFSNTVLRNIGTPSSFNVSGFGTFYLYTNGGGTTANVFSSTSAYIANYASSNFKQIIIDTTPETNSSSIDSLNFLNAALWRSTNAITSLTCFSGGTTFTANSTFTLYGITKG